MNRRVMISVVVAAMVLLPGAARAALVGYWSFDDGTGTLLTDTSGRDNHGTLAGTTPPTWVAGHTGRSGDYALSFSGSSVRNDANSPHVVLGNRPDLTITGDQTISMWLYPTSFATRQNPYAKSYSGTGTLTQEPAGTMNYYYGPGGNNSSPYQAFGSGALTLNQWNHVALVRDMTNNQLRWFVNGERTTTGTPTYTPGADTLPAYFARGYEYNYSGRIDDTAIFNHALPDVQVKAIASGALSPAHIAHVQAMRQDWLEGWMYRQAIVISKDAAGADLASFPVPIKLTDPANKLFSMGASANGYDVVFTAADGKTVLDHELESFSRAAGAEQLHAWVKTPLSSTQDTVIYMYYGGPDTGDPSSKATWDANFKLVQHFEETAGPYSDSTTNNHHMNAPNGASAAAGVFDGAVSKSGYGGQQYLVAQGGVSIPAGTSFTLEGWANFSDDGVSPQNQYLFSIGGRAAIRGLYGGDPRLGIIWQGAVNGEWNATPNLDITGDWHHVVQVYDATQGTYGKMYMYLDGQLISPADGVAVGGTLSGGDAYYAGTWVSSYGWLPGSFDEFRISNVARSPEWIAATYRLMTDGNLIAFGAQQHVPEPSSLGLLAAAVALAGAFAVRKRRGR